MTIINKNKDIIVVTNRETKETRTIIILTKLILPSRIYYKIKETIIEIRNSTININSLVTKLLAT